ncbi:MAG: transglutaminase domain-containing protein, partial [Solobacterium sp.]|nr:transglutaminase domain-containing protein [Solobacterium sp.]
FYTHGEAEGVPAVEFIPPFSRRTLGFDSWNEDLAVSDLRNAGPNPETYRSIMRVYSDRDGVEYLRGASYAYFDDNVWRMASDDDFEGVDLSTVDIMAMPYDFMGRPYTDAYTIEVHTTRHGGIYYVPFTAMTDELEFMHADEAYYDNVDYETIYRFAANPYMLKRHTNIDYLNTVNRVYAGLSEQQKELYAPIVREFSELYLQDIVNDMGLENLLVSRLPFYLQQKSTYSRMTSAVPEGRDLTDWFINDSDTGYCVHFATAAALLLRMYGIPTRYVTGYRVTTRAGMYVDVLEKEAHAWVEWFDPNSLSWIILDPTPAALTDEEATEEPEFTPPPVNEQQTETPVPETEATPEPLSPGQTVEAQAFELPAWLVTSGKVILVYGLYRLMALLLLKAYLHDKDRRRQTLRYYHYYMFITGLFSQPRNERATVIAEKAKFSRSGVTVREKNELARMVKKTYQDRLWYERLVYLVIGL